MTIGNKLKAKNYPLELIYDNGSCKYIEQEDGRWEIIRRDEHNKVVSFETSKGICIEYPTKEEFKGYRT